MAVRRNLRRSRSERPPQIPKRSSWASAYSRHSARTSQPEQIRLASRVEPPFSGKNASGSVCAQRARSCQSCSSASSSPRVTTASPNGSRAGNGTPAVVPTSSIVAVITFTRLPPRPPANGCPRGSVGPPPLNNSDVSTALLVRPWQAEAAVRVMQSTRPVVRSAQWSGAPRIEDGQPVVPTPPGRDDRGRCTDCDRYSADPDLRNVRAAHRRCRAAGAGWLGGVVVPARVRARVRRLPRRRPLGAPQGVSDARHPPLHGCRTVLRPPNRLPPAGWYSTTGRRGVDRARRDPLPRDAELGVTCRPRDKSRDRSVTHRRRRAGTDELRARGGAVLSRLDPSARVRPEHPPDSRSRRVRGSRAVPVHPRAAAGSPGSPVGADRAVPSDHRRTRGVTTVLRARRCGLLRDRGRLQPRGRRLRPAALLALTRAGAGRLSPPLRDAG